MNENEIQKRVDALCNILQPKGLREPVVHASINAHEEPSVYYRWTDANGRSAYDWVSHSVKGATVKAAINAAEVEILAIPTLAENQFSDFMQAVAHAVDLGRKNGIDVELVNPLEKLMKDLSENAITDQRKAK